MNSQSWNESSSGIEENGARREETADEDAPEENASTHEAVEEGETSVERAKRATRLAAPEEASVPLDFEAEDLAQHLARASDEDLNKAAFGAIRLDEGGIIQFYSAFEQRLSGYAPEETVGKSFFEEIAPCTDSERFSGRFFEGVEGGDMDETFTYTFTYRMEPLIVKIRLLEDAGGQYYVLVDAMR
jgi:photoactive yellow protein